MNDDVTARVATLTEAQRTCLLLVRQHKTSKEIARILGIAKETVDQRIAAAVRKLGVATRTEAALLIDRSGIYDPIIYDPVHLAGEPSHDATAASHIGQQERADEVGEAQAAYLVGPASPPPALPLPLAWRGRRLPSNQQLALLMVVTPLALVAAAVLLIVGLQGLGELARGVVRAFN